MTVNGPGGELILFKVVGDEMGLTQNQTLTEAQFWQAITKNAAAGIAACILSLASTKKDTPS